MTDEHLLPEADWARVQAEAERIRSLLRVDADQAEADRHAPKGNLDALNESVSIHGE